MLGCTHLQTCSRYTLQRVYSAVLAGSCPARLWRQQWQESAGQLTLLDLEVSNPSHLSSPHRSHSLEGAATQPCSHVCQAACCAAEQSSIRPDCWWLQKGFQH